MKKSIVFKINIKKEILIAIGIILMICLIGLMDGCSDKQSRWEYEYEDCQKITRIEYVYPFHTLGCWLGEVP